MCFHKDKWQRFGPTKEYLDVVNELTSVTKLHNYSKNNFKYIAEVGDHWKTPFEFMNDGGGDCEDWARWYVDILVRIQKINEARFIVHGGYNKKRWGDKKYHHAICVFPYQGKLALFSNNQFRTGYKDFMAIGYFTFPDGIKYMEVRDWQGKILEKKYKWIGIF
jgi:hypothetical protein